MLLESHLQLAIRAHNGTSHVPEQRGAYYIKSFSEELAELERKATTATKETTRPDGIRIVENTEADRLQVFFPGKPDPATIARLKSNAFKWAPSHGCWQRQLTGNARYALRQVLPEVAAVGC